MATNCLDFFRDGESFKKWVDEMDEDGDKKHESVWV